MRCLTCADNVIQANSSHIATPDDTRRHPTASDGTGRYPTTPGDAIGKQQPRVRNWRASLLASYRLGDTLSGSLDARYGSREFARLNNNDRHAIA